MTQNASAAQSALDAIREQQRRSWNQFAPGWRKWDALTMEFLRPIGEALLRETGLKPGMRVLDAACGTGEPGLTAARLVGPSGRVVGTDLSEAMLAVAREKARALGLANYEALVADAGALPLESESFDAVLCRMGMMFFPDPQKAAREFLRVLKPGARLALCAWAESGKNPWAATIADIVNRELNVPPPPPDAPSLFRHGGPGALATILTTAGFTQVQEDEISGECRYESPLEYWNLFTEVAAPIAGPLAKADAPARKRIEDQVTAAAGKFVREGSVRFPWSARVACGRRA